MSIIRKGAEAQKFNAPKVFADYMANKAADEAKEAAIAAENKRKQEELEKQKRTIPCDLRTGNESQRHCSS